MKKLFLLSIMLLIGISSYSFDAVDNNLDEVVFVDKDVGDNLNYISLDELTPFDYQKDVIFYKSFVEKGYIVYKYDGFVFDSIYGLSYRGYNFLYKHLYYTYWLDTGLNSLLIKNKTIQCYKDFVSSGGLIA